MAWRHWEVADQTAHWIVKEWFWKLLGRPDDEFKPRYEPVSFKDFDSNYTLNRRRSNSSPSESMGATGTFHFPACAANTREVKRKACPQLRLQVKPRI